MNSGWPGSGWRRAAAHSASALALLAPLAGGPIPARSQQFNSNAEWRNVTIGQYQQHLKDLDALVAACQAQRSAAGAAPSSLSACDPGQIGPDDRVQLLTAASSEAREVRYDWLRSVISRASKKDGAAGKSIFSSIPPSTGKPESVDSLLAAARQRLQYDAAQAAMPAAAAPNFSGERKSLNTILSQRAYQGVNRVSVMSRLREWFDNLLDRFFGGLVRFASNSPWIVWLLRILLITAICAALVWILLRIERRSRVRLIPDLEPAPGAPSAREWQLWLRDAQDMAAQRRWREAIHLLYWAAIARLESKRLWPADRARTPREYLALLAGSDPRKSSLATLTRSFERTWYGGRTAQASDFSAAMEQAAALGVAPE